LTEINPPLWVRKLFFKKNIDIHRSGIKHTPGIKPTSEGSVLNGSLSQLGK
jgi:hypothetical protein